jgi:hypothetical protein
MVNLIFVISGVMSEFIGSRDIDGIVGAIKNKNLPPVEEPSDVVSLTSETFESFLNDNVVTVVEFYTSWWLVFF